MPLLKQKWVSRISFNQGIEGTWTQMKVIVLKEVAEDLEEGRLFYDRKEPGIGDYFFDSLISELM